ncbi:FORMIN-LIKE PROTEIN [Salix purpurea]|uniref:Formin-like protein n=1 Tax=Salix purpurea TaxID=77065 RepID=A0A9Q0NNI5_SALPP|nr:FORMIN-LIKE PROTEIN [Salix purpurea]
MSCAPQVLRMIFIVTVCMLVLLLQGAHLLIYDASVDAQGCIKALGLPLVDTMEESTEDVNDKKRIEKVSGEDESKGKEALIVQKFRALLGLKSSRRRSSSVEFVSPAPSPSATIEAEPPAFAPAPAPKLPFHVHSYSPLHHNHQASATQKIWREHKDKSRLQTILIAVLGSTGAAFLVCVLGLFWLSGKFKEHRKKAARIMSMQREKGRSRGKSKFVSSRKSPGKVSLNPALDLLYLNSLEKDLEQRTTYLNRIPETVNTLSNHSTPKTTIHERQESKQELVMKSDSAIASSSSTREIMPVHDDVESVMCESDGGIYSSGDKIIPIDCHSSDDESLHSFVDSRSSNARLSNASAGNLNDISEIPPSNALKIMPSPSPPPKNPNIQEETLVHDKNFTAQSPPLPRPPPPPPLAWTQRMCMPLSSKSLQSTRMASKASSYSTLPNLSPLRKSGASSGSDRTTRNHLPASPQKSPKPTGVLLSIPPPPCPPPFLKGNIGSTSGQRPSPSHLSQYTVPLGKDGAPLTKLKPLHWDKVRAAPDQSMVWDKIRSSSFELDEEMIESLFGYNLQSKEKNDEAKSKTPSPTKHVLEPKRLQNIAILSKSTNATAEQVCDALMRGDGLCLQQLEALAKMVPTKEEEAKLFGYKGNINELGSAEKFIRVVLSIPFAFQRVEAMLYRETFEDEVVHLKNSFSMLEEACKELRSSRLFFKLLEAVLKTGNRMNVGTIRGGAKAFKLDALLKLSDVKGTDGKTTLLHFVVQETIRSEGIRVSDSIMGKINQKNKTKTVEEMEENYRRMGHDLVSGLSTELYNVKRTATIDLDVLASSVSNLSDGMGKLQQLVNKTLLTDEKSRNFVHTTKTFLNYASRNLKELHEDEDRVMLHVREITEYFHGNVSKEEPNPLRIFVIVRDFLGMLDHVCKELRSLKVPGSPNPLAPFR